MGTRASVGHAPRGGQKGASVIRFSARALALVMLGGLSTSCGGYGGGGDYGTAPQPVLLLAGALSGASETAVIDPLAHATTIIEVHDDGTVHFALSVGSSWLANVTGARIHRGDPGLDGPIEIDLLASGATLDPSTRTASGDLTISTALAAEMITYPAYF